MCTPMLSIGEISKAVNIRGAEIRIHGEVVFIHIATVRHKPGIRAKLLKAEARLQNMGVAFSIEETPLIEMDEAVA